MDRRQQPSHDHPTTICLYITLEQFRGQGQGWAFLGNFLDASATTEIACDLGMADATSLALWDTGAALNASVGKLPVLRGSVKANTTYVSTSISGST
jgi:hypothetical protein